MQRNTITTLGLLRVGDRFCLVPKKDVWQVVARGKKSVTINQFGPQGDCPHPWDVMKPIDTKVRFLRHTIMEMGDECLVEHLQVGDVFTTRTNVVIEYQVVARSFVTRRVEAVTLDGTAQGFEFTYDHEVVFIRKTKEVA